MRQSKTLFAGLLSLALAASLTTSAFALGEEYKRTLTLGQNMQGNLNIEDVGIGDKVTLTLINPTNQALVFQAPEMGGTENEVVVPANSQRTISFIYNTPFSDDVEFSVLTPTQEKIAEGVLFDINEDEYFRQTITLQPGMQSINMDELGVGDTVILTLINPTNQALTVETTDQLGAESRWVVPANSQRQVTFEYTQPFSDDIELMVTNPTGQVITRGVLFDVEQPAVRRQTIRGFW